MPPMFGTASFPQGQFSHVIHAATEASAKLNGDAPLVMFDTIVDGTRRVLQFSLSHSVGRFLFVSSGAVYGNQPSHLTHISESFAGGPDPLDRASAYAEGKRAAELLCAVTASPSLETTVARCFAFVGPYMQLDAHFAIGNFIADALGGGPVHVKGDGSPFRSYLYASDLAVWLWTMLFKGRSGRAYNVGSEDALSIAARGPRSCRHRATKDGGQDCRHSITRCSGPPLCAFHRARPDRAGPARRSALARRHSPHL